MSLITKVKVAKFSFFNEKSYIKTVIDFNFGRHKDLSTQKSDNSPTPPNLIEVHNCITLFRLRPATHLSVFLTVCLLGNFACFCRLLIFSKSTFSKISFGNTIRVSNILDPDQARCFVGPDLCPNCSQTLSVVDKTEINIFAQK